MEVKDVRREGAFDSLDSLLYWGGKKLSVRAHELCGRNGFVLRELDVTVGPTDDIEGTADVTEETIDVIEGTIDVTGWTMVVTGIMIDVTDCPMSVTEGDADATKTVAGDTGGWVDVTDATGGCIAVILGVDEGTEVTAADAQGTVSEEEISLKIF